MKRIALAAVLAVSIGFASSAHAALNAYLKLKGQKTGDVKGGVTQKGREGSIAVVSVDHSIVSPRDPQSGLPTGQRMHKPIVIRKELDMSTPILFNMLVTNENIPSFELKFWTPQLGGRTGVGQEKQHFTIKLVNANIASIRFVQPNVKDPQTQKLAEYEEIAFTYQKITWTWNDGGITAGDDWLSRQ